MVKLLITFDSSILVVFNFKAVKNQSKVVQSWDSDIFLVVLVP